MAATETSHSIETVLNCPNLPTLPSVAVQLLELIRDPDVGIADIRKLVESDTGLAGRVLKTVNSSAFGLRQKCNNIQRALGYLGMSSIKSLVLGFSLVDWTKDVDGEGFDLDGYWRRLIFSAAGARRIAVEFRACDPDDAFTGALFQDMGMLAMLTRLGPTYLMVAQSCTGSHDLLTEAEQSALGFDHAQAGAALGEKWHLPSPTVQCVRHHHAPDRAPAEYRELVRVVALSRMVACALSEPDPRPIIQSLSAQAMKWFATPHADVLSVVEQVSQAGHELSKVFNQNIGARPDLHAILSEAGEQLLEHQVVVARQVNDLEQEKETLRKSSLTDAMTGAWNRKHFDQVLADAFEKAERTGRSVAVIFMDGDKFKSVNDTYGHQTGDAVIQVLAERMTEVVGDRGVVCRYGGEEFAAIIENISTEQCAQIADRIRARIADTPFELSGIEGAPNELPVTASLGVSVWTAGMRHCTPEALVHEADEAVYQSKQDGRNRVSVHANCTTVPADTTVSIAAASPTGSAVIPAHFTGVVTRVLLAESDPLAAKLLDAVLSQAKGVEVHSCGDLAGARAFLARVTAGELSPPDIIITDVNLQSGTVLGAGAGAGGAGGADFIKAIRAVPPLADTPVIVVAGPSDAQAIMACRAAGATAVYSRSAISRHVTRWTKDVLALTRPAKAA